MGLWPGCHGESFSQRSQGGNVRIHSWECQNLLVALSGPSGGTARICWCRVGQKVPRDEQSWDNPSLGRAQGCASPAGRCLWQGHHWLGLGRAGEPNHELLGINPCWDSSWAWDSPSWELVAGTAGCPSSPPWKTLMEPIWLCLTPGL